MKFTKLRSRPDNFLHCRIKKCALMFCSDVLPLLLWFYFPGVGVVFASVVQVIPFLYLGLPVGGDARKIQFWLPLVDKIRARLSGWKCRYLSMGGRLVLLKSVLSSMPVYFLSFFKAPSASDTAMSTSYNRFLRVKPIPLKVNLFMWRLFLNRLPTKDNLHRRGVLDASGLLCATSCGQEETLDHLFFQCNMYGRIWPLISGWLGFEAVFPGSVDLHSTHFSGLGGASKSCNVLLISIWAAVLFTIWKDRNNRIFKNSHATIEALAEQVKFHTFWWLKSSFILFDFDYSVWRANPLNCCHTLV
ncbi:hypothetical protein TSUD_239720 [Trifolium subterraneum]|uniref:Reverse transcriptase zinc-binding domain-containing protein n=1 Tax=Trifolium subterraneum TaxID=3900 RepID=A0A2Z6PBG6_TRISU|nr:hypothetical protein TSUD_239720 [Trifolium subterraneum]